MSSTIHSKFTHGCGWKVILAGLLSVGGGLLLTSSAHAGFVQNPSFESNYNDAWPHYGPVDMWTGGSGVNESSGPFHNSGTPIPDQTRAAFKQGTGALSQEITGLTIGKQYWIQFFYDARNCCNNPSIDLQVIFNNVTLTTIKNVTPSTGGAPYKSATIAFTADVDTGTLQLNAVVNSGDGTLNFDAVTIVERDSNNLSVLNPSFEASGDVPDPGVMSSPPAGWSATGVYGINLSGVGQYADNGVTPDQDHVLFLYNISSVSQVVPGLSVGKPYQLTFAYNAKTGNNPRLQVKVGDTVMFEENVSPVGGTNPYRTKTVTFTATDISALITFAQTTAGDQTLLLDRIQVTGETAKPLPPLDIKPVLAELAPGDTITVTVTVPNELLAIRAADLQFGSSAAAVARLVGADTNGVVTLHFDKGGNNVQTLTIESVARGVAALNVINSSGLTVTDSTTTRVVTSSVKNASFESAPAPGGIGTGSILAWMGGTGLNAAGGPFWDNGLIPDRKQVAFLQGANTLSQRIAGLTPGEDYWLQFFYNARNCCGGTIDLVVKFDGTELAKITNIQPVGEGMPFYFTNLTFKPTATGGLVEFVTTAAGDATVLLDAINVVQRDPVDVLVINPSFEASGVALAWPGYIGDPIAGWEASGGRGINIDTVGPFTDNGRAFDQDAVLFLQGAGSISQNITGLTANKNYVLLFWANARNCCTAPNETGLRVSFADTSILEENVMPVGGGNSYLVKQVKFTPTDTQGLLRIEHVPPGGDLTLLVDNVRILPEGQIRAIITVQPQGGLFVRGDSVSLSVEAFGTEPISYQWQRNGANLPGKTSALLDLGAVTPDQSGVYTAVISNNAGSRTSQAAIVTIYEKVMGAFNTGMAEDRTLLSDGVADPHYVLAVNPNDPASNVALVVNEADRPGSWVENTDTSRWIGPVAAPAADPLPAGGFYTYRLTLDLTGYDPSNAFVSGSWAADNGMHGIYLNDNPTGFVGGGFTSWTPFAITKGFKAGRNTLDFILYNIGDPNPTGLQIQDLKIGANFLSVAPTLAVAKDGAQVKIAWASSATGFSLQKAPAVTGPWNSESTAAVLEGSQWVVRVAPTATAQFYRLAK